MEPNQVPQRSTFWFSTNARTGFSGQLFDQITIVFAVGLALLSFVVFWPIISQIDFEEAFFTPLAPFLMGILGTFGLSANEAIRVLFVGSFMVSTVGIYLLVRDLTKRQMPAIFAALIYIIPPVPVFVLTYLRRGLYVAELESARSFLTIVYGDGANFLALALIPLGAIFFLRYLKQARKIDFVVTVVVCALVLLASRSQALNLLLILSVFAISEFFLGLARIKIRRFLLIIIFSIGIVSFWYTLVFWRDTFSIFNIQVIGNLRLLFPLPLILGALSFLFSFVFFARKEERQAIFVSFLLFIVFSTITINWLATGRTFMPHPQRLLPNLNMFAAMVFGLSVTAIVDKLRLAQIFNFESWQLRFRVWGALFFGLVSFLILTLSAFFLSPLAILLVTGPISVWSRIRQPILTERLEVLRLAGGNFKLVKVNDSDWQIVFGIGLTLFFLVVLAIFLVRSVLEQEAER